MIVKRPTMRKRKSDSNIYDRMILVGKVVVSRPEQKIKTKKAVAVQVVGAVVKILQK